ncbi:hypothetical protein AAZX31_05G062000 [Glycine max]|nr:hypothetical protein GLYMA_05G063950v4 [Glycine max]KAH1133087.1 hypothetical protein GYH30_011771 [Glycine max]
MEDEFSFLFLFLPLIYLRHIFVMEPSIECCFGLYSMGMVGRCCCLEEILGGAYDHLLPFSSSKPKLGENLQVSSQRRED